MSGLFVDNPRAVWRVRLNNWVRFMPFDMDGVSITWNAGFRYTVTVTRVVNGKLVTYPTRTIKGVWSKAIDQLIEAIVCPDVVQESRDVKAEKPSTWGGNRKAEKASRFTGVTRGRRGWRVTVYIGRKQINLGEYADENKAAEIYNNYVVAHGLDKALNDIESAAS